MTDSACVDLYLHSAKHNSAMMMQRKTCGHCNKELSEKAYKEHFKLYFHGSRWVTVSDLSRKVRIPDEEGGSNSSSTTPISVPETTPGELESGLSVELYLEENQNTSDSDMDCASSKSSDIGNQGEVTLQACFKHKFLGHN